MYVYNDFWRVADDVKIWISRNIYNIELVFLIFSVGSWTMLTVGSSLLFLKLKNKDNMKNENNKEKRHQKLKQHKKWRQHKKLRRPKYEDGLYLKTTSNWKQPNFRRPYPART